MKIMIQNGQDKLPVTKEVREIIRKAASASLKYMDFPKNVEISVLLTDNEEIRKLNKLHREIDKATDVLSFPMFEYDENGDIIEEYADFSEEGDLCLGDIVISLERAMEQSEEYGHTFLREVGFLTVHSMLHLFGYDHMNDDDEKEMFGYQREILNEMDLKR